MDYARLGSSGLRVSRICLGMMSFGKRKSRDWHLDEEAARPLIHQAAEAGITYFDTADMYDDGGRDGSARTVRAGNDPNARSLYDDSDFDIVDVVRQVADARGTTPAQIALAWLQSKPGVTSPIVGATNAAHLADAVDSVALVLEDDEILRLEQPYRPHTIRGHT